MNARDFEVELVADAARHCEASLDAADILDDIRMPEAAEAMRYRARLWSQTAFERSIRFHRESGASS